MTIETAVAKLSAVPGGVTQDRINKLQSVDENAALVVCGDEKTGRRFGQAKCRVGRCVKIGSGGRNSGSAYAYQVWAVWA